jgi:hypothetical protein
MFEDVFEELPWHLRSRRRRPFANGIKWPDWKEDDA